jgi:hypothetical protein
LAGKLTITGFLLMPYSGSLEQVRLGEIYRLTTEIGKIRIVGFVDGEIEVSGRICLQELLHAKSLTLNG